MSEGKPMYGICGGLAHDAGSGSFVSWDNTKCNPIASAREQSRSAWEDGYASAKREWVGLTDGERNHARQTVTYSQIAMTASEWTEAVQIETEKRLKEKNT